MRKQRILNTETSGIAASMPHVPSLYTLGCDVFINVLLPQLELKTLFILRQVSRPLRTMVDNLTDWDSLYSKRFTDSITLDGTGFLRYYARSQATLKESYHIVLAENDWPQHLSQAADVDSDILQLQAARYQTAKILQTPWYPAAVGLEKTQCMETQLAQLLEAGQASIIVEASFLKPYYKQTHSLLVSPSGKLYRKLVQDPKTTLLRRIDGVGEVRDVKQIKNEFYAALKSGGLVYWSRNSEIETVKHDAILLHDFEIVATGDYAEIALSREVGIRGPTHALLLSSSGTLESLKITGREHDLSLPFGNLNKFKRVLPYGKSSFVALDSEGTVHILNIARKISQATQLAGIADIVASTNACAALDTAGNVMVWGYESNCRAPVTIWGHGKHLTLQPPSLFDPAQITMAGKIVVQLFSSNSTISAVSVKKTASIDT